MKTVKKLTAFFILVAFLSLLIIAKLTLLINGGYKSVFIDKMVKYTIVIDAGHGGIDGGATGATTGVFESDLNLKICRELESLFKGAGFITKMTRTDENGLYGDTSPRFKKRDLNRRVEICNQTLADAFISVHLNTYSSSSRRGAQVFFKGGNEEGKRLADAIQLELNLLKESKRM